jgi:hypothetical protein
MKVMTYICDRCGETIEEDDVTKVSFSHGRGKFDLRDEEFELCPLCDQAAIEWARTPVEKRP